MKLVKKRICLALATVVAVSMFMVGGTASAYASSWGSVAIHQGIDNSDGSVGVLAENITSYYPETGPLLVYIDSAFLDVPGATGELIVTNSKGERVFYEKDNKYLLSGQFRLTGFKDKPAGKYRVQIVWGSLDLGTDGYKDFTLVKGPHPSAIVDDDPGAGSGTEGTFTNASGKQIDVSVAKVPNFTWTGKQAKPSPKVTANGAVLVKGTDYTLTYSANKNIGKGKLSVVGKGKYKGNIAVTFKIVPKKPTALKVKAAKKALNVTFKKVSKAQKITTYKVQYRVKGTAAWKSKIVKVKLSSKAKNASVKIDKLKGNATYQVRAYAYKGTYVGAPTGVKATKTKN